MVEGLTKSPENAPKEAPKKLQKRVGKNEVKGFYYHAAEYQRQRQAKEKNLVKKMFSSLVAPFSIHIRAAQLRHRAALAGGAHQAWVIDNDFAQKALNNELKDEDKQKFKAKTQVHTVFEKYQVNKADETMAKSVLQEIFNKQGKLSKEDVARLQQESGMDFDDIASLVATAKENAGNGYFTVDEMKGKFTDEAIFGGLTEDQKQIATKICLSSWGSTVLAAGKYGLIAAMAINPLFLGGIVTSAVVSGGLNFGLRVSNLLKEGNTYAMNKVRGVDHKLHINWLNRIMGVDWDKEQKAFQILRAAGVGAALGIVLRLRPEISDWLGEHIGHVSHAVSGTSAHAEIAKGSSDIVVNSQEVTHQVGLSQIGVSGYHATAWEGAQHGATWAYDVHNTWTDHSMYFNIYKDADQINYFALHMPNNQVALVDLAHSSITHHGNEFSFTFDANNTQDSFALMDANGHSIGTITSSEAFKLFNSSGHLAPATGASSDFSSLTQGNIRSLIDFGHYQTNGSGGLDFTRIGEIQGHGGFADLQTLNITQHVVVPNLQVPGEATEQFHSALGPALQDIDTHSDNLLELLREHVPYIGGQGFVEALDNVTDHALENTDSYAYLWQTQPWYAAGIATGLVAAGYASAITRPHAAKKIAGTVLTIANPGMAIVAGVGYVIGRLRNGRINGKKKKSEPKPTKPTEPAPKPVPVPVPTPIPQPSPQPIPPTPVASIGPEPGSPTSGIQQPTPVTPPAPPVQPTNPDETLTATLPGTPSETLPTALPALSEPDYVNQVNQNFVQLENQLPIDAEKQQNLLTRLNDALRNGSYVNRNSNAVVYRTNQELLDLVSQDFDVTPEQKDAINHFITTYQTLHDQVAYTSAKQFAGEHVTAFDKKEYDTIKSQATIEHIKQLYTELTQNPTDESLNRQIDEAVATLLQIGVPFVRSGLLPWEDIFDTNFTSSMHAPDYGQADQSSIAVDAVDEELNKQLRSEHISLENKSTMETYEDLESAKRNELLVNAAQKIATRYQTFLESHNQTVAGAGAMLTHLLKANIAKGQDIRTYPLPSRPAITVGL